MQALEFECGNILWLESLQVCLCTVRSLGNRLMHFYNIECGPAWDLSFLWILSMNRRLKWIGFDPSLLFRVLSIYGPDRPAEQ